MESSVAFPSSSSSVAPGSSSSSTSKHFYCMVNSIPDSFHTSDLRNFFSEYIDGEKFDMFHFRHRPQIVNVENERKSESGAGNSKAETKATLKRFCCPVRFNEESVREKFIRRYHKKLWMDKEGNDLPVRCIITKVSLNTEDLQKFANKELHPPKFMSRGNVGTPNAHFLNLIRECRLLPSLIKKLELEFPRARKFKRYSKVPPPPILNKGAKVVLPENENDDDDEEIKTAKGHSISDVFIPKSSKEHSSGLNSSEGQEESDKESNADDDDDRCEEWERHEALHDHRTTHGDMTSESKERLYEEEIELQWEKGGPGIVWYTDALYWDQQRGSFDERTSDDWDVDVEGYYEPDTNADSKPKETGKTAVIIPDEQALLVPSLLNYDAPHYFARFIIIGCPPGLEILDKYEHLSVIRRPQNAVDLESAKRLLAYSQFDVKNSRGMQLYIALEKVKRQSLNWIRDARLFEVNFFDFHCRKVFCVKRIFSLKYFFSQYICLFFTFGFKGCGNAIEVTLGNGTKIGTVRQKMSYSSTVFHIFDEEDKCIMIVDGVVADGILDVTFPGEDEPIAMIETLMSETEAFDFYRVNVPLHSSVTGITFFKDFITPEQKALLLSTTILLEYITLKPTSDYPHFCEVIPDDYQEYPKPYYKLHRDASKELLILSENKRKQGTGKMKGKWGCCIWCGKLCCMCFFLGMRRNAIRCSCLMFFFNILLILTVILCIVTLRFYRSVLIH